MTPHRFARLEAGAVAGVKLLGRREVVPALTDDEAYDSAGFGTLLKARLGEPDDGGDADFSYAIIDRRTGVRFRAYAAQSGPAYGGSPAACFVDDEHDDRRLKPAVLQSLRDFEAWLTSRATGVVKVDR